MVMMRMDRSICKKEMPLGMKKGELEREERKRRNRKTERDWKGPEGITGVAIGHYYCSVAWSNLHGGHKIKKEIFPIDIIDFCALFFSLHFLLFHLGNRASWESSQLSLQNAGGIRLPNEGGSHVMLDDWWPGRRGENVGWMATDRIYQGHIRMFSSPYNQHFFPEMKWWKKVKNKQINKTRCNHDS